MAAGFQGQDLASQLLNRQLQNRQTQQTIDAERKKQLATAAIGRAMAQAGIQQPQFAPRVVRPNAGAATQQPAAGQTQTLPAGQSADAGNVAAASQGGAALAAEPAVPGAQGASLAPNAPGPTGQAPAAAQSSASPAQDRSQTRDWQQVIDRITQDPQLDPEVKALAVAQLQVLSNNDENRALRERTQLNDLDYKKQRDFEQLKFKYEDAERRSNDTRLTLDARMKAQREADDTRLQIANLNNERAVNVAGMNNNTRLAQTSMREGAQLERTMMLIGSKEKIADASNKIKLDLGNAALDVKADQVAKDFYIRNRANELKEQGMSNQQAQFYAKLESTEVMARARDETIRRGQDLVYKAKQEGIQGKLDAARAGQANAMDATAVSLDELAQTADELLKMPGLDSATGPIQQYLLTISDDTADFEAKLKTLQSQVGLSAINQMKALSRTGGSGLGSVSNFELQSLQNSLAPLSLGQSSEAFRDALLKIKDHANASKARLYAAWEKEQVPKAKGTGGAGVPVVTPEATAGAKSVAVPPAFAKEPDGATLTNAEGTWTKKGDQLLLTTPKK